MRRNHFAVVIAALLMLVATGSFAQETTGTLTRRVVDSQGLAMPGVTVTATGAQGSKSATTDGDGRFRIPFMTPGAYDVQAELQGFKTVKQTGVTVGLGQTIELAGPNTKIIPGHGPIVDRNAVIAQRDFVLATRERMLPLIAKGMTYDQVLAANLTADSGIPVPAGEQAAEQFIWWMYVELTNAQR